MRGGSPAFRESIMLKATFTEFRQHAKKYFDAIEQGEIVKIIRHSKVIAEVRPASCEVHVPSWKKPGLKLAVKGVSLAKSILKERKK